MAKITKPETFDYEGWAKVLGDKDARKIGNNTYVERGAFVHRTWHADAVAIRLHSTAVLAYLPKGSIVINSGGWRTVTTLSRLNACLPQRYYIRQAKGVWYFGDRVHDVEFPFSDGFTIAPETSVPEPEPFDLVSSIIAFESGDLDDDEVVDLFQHLVDTDAAWSLQGSYGRTAAALIGAGLVTA